MSRIIGQPGQALLNGFADFLPSGSSFTGPGLSQNGITVIALDGVPDLTGIAIGNSISGPGIDPLSKVRAVSNLTMEITSTIAAGPAAAHGDFTFSGGGATPTLKQALFTNAPALRPGMTIADFVEPTFPAYARVTVTQAADRSDGQGDVILRYSPATFQPDATTGLPQTANGTFLLADYGDHVDILMAAYFPTPVVFGDETDGHTWAFTIVVPNQCTFGGISGE